MQTDLIIDQINEDKRVCDCVFLLKKNTLKVAGVFSDGTGDFAVKKIWIYRLLNECTSKYVNQAVLFKLLFV